MKEPFIHKFQSIAGHYYIYDVNTNEIISVDNINYDILDDFVKLSNTEIIAKWAYKYRTSDINMALLELKKFHDNEYFSSKRPLKFRKFLAIDEIKEKLKSNVEFLILNITENCNLRCRYCTYSGTYYFERKHSKKNMSKDIIRKAINFFFNHSKNYKEPSIAFYGGEPLLVYNNILFAINLTKQLDFKTHVNLHVDTNGTLLTNEMIDFFIANRIGIQISLDGPKRIHDMYRLHRNNKPSHNIIMQRIITIINKNQDYSKNYVTLQSTIIPTYDLLEINDFYKTSMFDGAILSTNYMAADDTNFFRKHKIKKSDYQQKQRHQLMLNYIDARVHAKDPSLFEKALFEGPLVKLHKRVKKISSDEIAVRGICVPGQKRLFVSTDGIFRPCERTGSAFSIGCLDSGFNYNSIEKLIYDYINSTAAECMNCWAQRLCSVCFANARKADEFSADRKRKFCAGTRTGIDEALKIYASIMEKNHHGCDFTANVVVSS